MSWPFRSQFPNSQIEKWSLVKPTRQCSSIKIAKIVQKQSSESC